MLQEKNLTFTEDSIRRILNNLGSTYFLYSYNCDGQFTYLSRSVTDMLGYSTEEFSAHHRNYLTENPVNQRAMEFARQSLAGLKTPTYEIELYHKNGAIVRLEITETPVFGSDAQVVAVEGMAHNISERTSIRHDLEKSQRRLKEAQSIAQLGSWEWDISSQKFIWSEQAYRIYGQNPATFEPNFDKFITCIHPDDRDTFRTALIQTANKGEGFSMRHRVLHADGKILIVESKGQLFFDSQRRTNSILGTVLDISEQDKIEQELRTAKQAAERANQVKSNFLSNMGHELRTPLNVIAGFTQLCLNSSLTEKQRYYLTKVSAATDSLGSLVDNILDYANMEKENLSLNPQVFALKDILESIYAATYESCLNKGLEFTVNSLVTEPLYLNADLGRLKQVLLHLLNNAVKFTAQGKVSVLVKELKREQGLVSLEFSVTDTGIGIGESEKNQLFQSFSQTDNGITRHYGGTGIGLIMVKKIVEKMHGSVFVHSQIKVGSTFGFILTLPVAMIDEQDEQPQPTVLPVTVNNLKDAHILLVEDNNINQLVANALLTKMGLQVEIAENGAVAVEKIHDKHYDCVLMDIQMPIMDGYQAVQLIRKNKRFADLVIIAMTADADTSDKDKCLEAGMNDYISKPIDKQHLYDTLNKWIKPKYTNAAIISDSSKVIELENSNLLPELSGINTRLGLSHTGEDVVLYRKVLEKFADNQADFNQEINLALTENDSEKAIRLAHTLKGLAGSLGAQALQKQALLLETALRQQNKADIAKFVATTNEELSKIIVTIRTASWQHKATPNADKEKLSDNEMNVHLKHLLEKLNNLDADADEFLENILKYAASQNLEQQLLRLKKKINNYDFETAAIMLETIIKEQSTE